jgi:hypothetical protein
VPDRAAGEPALTIAKARRVAATFDGSHFSIYGSFATL